MKVLSRRKIKALWLGFCWVIVACGSIVLLVAAVRKNDSKACKGINVQIEGVRNHYFIDKKDVEKIIAMYEGGQNVGKPIANFDLAKMENALQKNIWIKRAQVYFDNNGMLQVEIEEREPVARIFTIGGSSFYIDSSLMMLPLSDKLSARLPVFTGFPSEAAVLHRRDSALLKDIKTISLEIQADPFLNSMIDQVDITLQRQFEMIPKVGNQLILFGEATEVTNKFRNLKLFYKKIITKTGWNRYSAINLQYKNQVVAKIRGADDVSADSLRTTQLMQLIAINTERLAADTARSFAQDSDKNTTDSTMILQSIQRDEAQEGLSQPVPAPTKPNAAEGIRVEEKLVLKPVAKSNGKSTMTVIKNKATGVKKVKPAAAKNAGAPKKNVKNDY